MSLLPLWRMENANVPPEPMGVGVSTGPASIGVGAGVGVRTTTRSSSRISGSTCWGLIITTMAAMESSQTMGGTFAVPGTSSHLTIDRRIPRFVTVFSLHGNLNHFLINVNSRGGIGAYQDGDEHVTASAQQRIVP
jgi:hypothetical protein